ncbi:hypothetical protein ACWCQP_36855 [Streptomyces chartreusis]
MPARLVDTGPIVYATPGQKLVQRNCRTWITEDGRTVSVVTEMPADTGMSITNAAEEVRAALEATWGVGCRIVEHYPSTGDEHYDEQIRRSASIRWHRLSTDALRAELGPELEMTKPTAAAAWDL